MLPYVTMEEAEEAMGRGLSYAERVWFRYSANKSDFVLHCHNIVFLCFFYSAASLPYVFIELCNNKSIVKCKVQPRVRNTFWQMFKCYKNVMHTFILAVGPLQILSFPTVKLLGIRTDLSLPSGWEFVLQLSVYFIIEDFANYWIHRILHSPWAYQKIHKVHHEYKAPHGLAAPYAHWAEILILGFPSFLGPTLVPCHITTYWLWFVLRQLEAIETHSGYEFPWSPTKYIPFYGGATYHDYHHLVGENCQCNFASVFTYCDLIYGTHKGYRYKTKLLKKASLNQQNHKTE
ncbi:methylsterol monooxygenase 1-1-like [Prosopis cineraria]|uniref:methylsterol monooxygenase 1-1-like n=1 Tax=Prosopis cineraria TaxID=364024 RepID=UPI00240EFE2D|nr:methylsterol monooxygenase 1-1-like [Prosopis cineraria]